MTADIHKKNICFNIILIAAGIASALLSLFVSGTAVKDFASGLLVGIGIGLVLVGLVFLIRELAVLLIGRER